MSEIKPCPLCGEPAVYEQYAITHAARCYSCGLTLCYPYTDVRHPVDTWNTRKVDHDGIAIQLDGNVYALKKIATRTRP